MLILQSLVGQWWDTSFVKSETSPKNWTRERLVFPALRSGSLDSRRADEEELHSGADAAHGAAGRERNTSGGSMPASWGSQNKPSTSGSGG
jgi:hypothetical protein